MSHAAVPRIFKKSRLKRFFVACLPLALILTLIPPESAAFSQPAALSYLQSQVLDEWSVMALGGANSLEGLNLDFLKTDPGDKPTDLEKRILAIAAMNADPRTFGVVDLIQKLVQNFDGTEINSTLAPNLLNDDIFGLLALTASGQHPAIRNQLAAFLKQNQNSDGGFGFTYAPAASDSNDTAMAIMALLANGENSNFPVIVKAVNYLAMTKTATGYSFDAVSNFGPDSASTSWVISALTALGQEVPPSSRVYLESLQLPDGSFSWQEGGQGSRLMTSYAVIALNNQFYPVHGQTSPPPAACLVSIHANQATLVVGETVFLEAIGFGFPVSWQVSDPTKASLNDSRISTGKNTAEVTGQLAGQIIITSTSPTCQANLTLTILEIAQNPPPALPQFSTTIQGPEGLVFQGILAFNQVSVTDSNNQVHHFPQPVALGTLVEAGRTQSFSFVVKNTSLGLFVESIAGFGPLGDKGWLYAVGGVKPNIGAAQFVLQNGDEVIWFYGAPGDLPPLVANPPPPSTSYPTPSTSYPTPSTSYPTPDDAHPSPFFGQNPTQDLGLSAHILPHPQPQPLPTPHFPPPSTIIFGLDTLFLNFGDLKAGETSGPQTINLQNFGNVHLSLTAFLQNADRLYEQGLKLNGLLWNNFQIPLLSGTNKTIALTLSVPQTYAGTGLKNATLIFWATPPQTN